MITIRFRMPSGEVVPVTTAPRGTLMQVALDQGFAEIVAECGGGCSCGTCQVIVAPEWSDRLPPVGDDEADMLAFAPNARPDARLSCQIPLTPDLDGIEVELPGGQG